MYAVEKDKRFVSLLKEFLKDFPQVKIIESDFLKLDISSLLQREERWKVICNPPYSIVAPLLFTLLEYPERMEFLLLMIQKEVAERLTALPGTKNYSLLTIKVRLNCEVQIIHKVSRRVFFPSPKVDSTLVKIIPQKGRRFPLEKELLKLAERIFQQRRKMLKNVLPLPPIFWEEVGISSCRRGETLSIEELKMLTQQMEEKRWRKSGS